MTRGFGGAAVLAAALALAGCGLKPIYAGGSTGVAATALAQVEIAPIADRAGYLVTAALRDRFGATAAAPAFRLEVELDDQIVGFGIRGDNTIARERRTLRARYRVIDATSGAVLLDATAAADAGIDRVSSDFAVVAAETTALQRLAGDVAGQISTRVARFAQSGGLGREP